MRLSSFNYNDYFCKDVNIINLFTAVFFFLHLLIILSSCTMRRCWTCLTQQGKLKPGSRDPTLKSTRMQTEESTPSGSLLVPSPLQQRSASNPPQPKHPESISLMFVPHCSCIYVAVIPYINLKKNRCFITVQF